ncbi:MAG: thiamine pyrophosphate-dependent enzyme [Pseudomonadota bacterium]
MTPMTPTQATQTTATTATTKLFAPPRSMSKAITHYCPGCTHGIIHRIVGEVIDELGIAEKTVGIAPVGCSVLIYNYYNIDFQEAPHGRAPALATGAKRARPDLIVFTYQGDGDLASIGTNEIIHAANRGEKITTIFVNNAIYGMTGGQMAPTSLPGQVTTTSPAGRDPATAGFPMRMCEMLATLRTPAFVVRSAVHTPQLVVQTKRAIRRAFELQIEGRCFAFVEVLSTCPTNWGMSPVKATQWVQENMVPYYALGLFKDPDVAELADGRIAAPRPQPQPWREVAPGRS